MSHYIPLDETLARTTMQILRALRWFDWVTSDELLTVIGVPDYDRSRNPDRNRYTSKLLHLVKSGIVQRNDAYWPYLYRITNKGRDALQRVAHDYEQRLRGAA
jgi:hypothetical protein